MRSAKEITESLEIAKGLCEGKTNESWNARKVGRVMAELIAHFKKKEIEEQYDRVQIIATVVISKEDIDDMKAAVENVEYGAFAWDKQRGVFVPIGRSVLAKQLCLNRYQERVRNGDIPSWIDPEKFKILERTVAEIAGDWKEAKDE